MRIINVSDELTVIEASSEDLRNSSSLCDALQNVLRQMFIPSGSNEEEQDEADEDA